MTTKGFSCLTLCINQKEPECVKCEKITLCFFLQHFNNKSVKPFCRICSCNTWTDSLQTLSVEKTCNHLKTAFFSFCGCKMSILKVLFHGHIERFVLESDVDKILLPHQQMQSIRWVWDGRGCPFGETLWDFLWFIPSDLMNVSIVRHFWSLWKHIWAKSHLMRQKKSITVTQSSSKPKHLKEIIMFF